jgi:hypothetical protein
MMYIRETHLPTVPKMFLIPSCLHSILYRDHAPVDSHVLHHSRIRFALKAVILLATVGCAASEDRSIGALLDADFRLRAGESASVYEVELEVGFIGVTADSRCGKGEVCIWEGDGIVRIWLQTGGQDREERELHTAAKMSDVTDYAGFRVQLVALNPASVSGVVIAADDYVAVLRVTSSGQ